MTCHVSRSLTSFSLCIINLGGGHQFLSDDAVSVQTCITLIISLIVWLKRNTDFDKKAALPTGEIIVSIMKTCMLIFCES